MAAPRRDAKVVRRRAGAGLSLVLGILALLLGPLLSGWLAPFAWARTKVGLLLLPAGWFLVELAFGRPVPELAREWDALPRWQQGLLGLLVVALVGGVFLALLIAAGE